MKILAIETSCDETAVSILEARKGENPRFEILSNIIASQVKLHAKYGGVYPFLAKREHQKNLPTVLKKALKKANFSVSSFQFPVSKKNPNTKIRMPKIDLVAVTSGPGLEPCLWVGINFAKELSEKLKAPLAPVNHIEAHILANFLDNPRLLIPRSQIFPAVCLIVSGGHTQLILMKRIGDYKILGETRDDAAGECFDKVARLLGLGYPGGPAIAAEAAKLKTKNRQLKTILPRPMIYQKNYDFSFSGLKTAVLYLVKQLTAGPKGKPSASCRAGRKQLTVQQKREITSEAQQAIIDVLLHKTLKAAKDYKVKSIILGGGVVANKELREQFEQKIKKELPDVKYIKPNLRYCTDNAAMTAVTGYYMRQRKKKWPMIEADSNLRVG